MNSLKPQNNTSKSANSITAILGGTFNPIHNGHIELAKKAYEQFDIPEILIMPCNDPSSYKDSRCIANSKHRCNMIEAAIKDYPYMHLSTLEIERKGLTYTSDTLQELLPYYNKIYFIIGADSLFGLPKWHKCEYVMAHCHLIVADRNQYSHADLAKQEKFLTDKYNAQISYLYMNEIPVSSTQIRKNISQNISIHNMVPDDVEKYILENHLYENENNDKYHGE